MDDYHVYYHSCPSNREPAVCLSSYSPMHQTNEVVQHNQKLHIMLLIFRTLFFLLIKVFFIMDAITAAACFFSPRLNNHSLWLCSLPEHSINITSFLGIAKCRSSGCPPVLYLQSAKKICPSILNREGELGLKKKKKNHSHQSQCSNKTEIA